MKIYENKEFCGGGFIGMTFKASVNEINEKIGHFDQGESGDGKVLHEWACKVSNIPFNVYDWKEYRDYADDELIEWHIGSEDYSKNGSDTIKKSLEQLGFVVTRIF